ncbi:MAG TPA: SCP2 sterol-binding domain-containing protein [Hyphomicrobiales bacterium]|nr:SCP2 sterol-binding domain-containing protein [Hyphomicrobiales bacterium]
MSLALLQSALLLPAEALVKRCLALDPLSATRLAPFEGRTLEIHCTRPELRLFISVRNSTLHLSPVHGGVADSRLSGNADKLLALLRRGSQPHSLHGSGVTLEGSTTLVAGLRDALLRMDVDWGYHLSRLIGDLPSAALERAAEASAAALTRGRQRLHEDVVDYLATERHLVLQRHEAQPFHDRLHALQLRLDRLQARLELLENRD